MTIIVTTQEELAAAIDGIAGMVKVTGKPNPSGSPAWRASMGGYVDRIGVSRYRVDELRGWWAWCGQCMEPIGPAYHPTWRGAMDAAAAHADRHRRENAARERAAALANTEGATR